MLVETGSCMCIRGAAMAAVRGTGEVVAIVLGSHDTAAEKDCIPPGVVGV